MDSWEPDEVDFEDQYDKADPIDDANLNESINELNRSIREQEELQEKLSRAEWSPINKDEIAKLGQQIAFNEKAQGLYITRASKTVLLILHRGFDKINQSSRVTVFDEKSAEELYKRLRLIESDKGTYKIAFVNESGTLKNVLSPGNRWLAPDAYLRIFGKKFMNDMGFNVNKPKSGAKSKIPKKRIERYEDEIDDARELNELPTSEDNQDNIMLQGMINKNDRKNDFILIMTPEKQDKTLQLSKHWSAGSTPERNEVIMKRHIQ